MVTAAFFESFFLFTFPILEGKRVGFLFAMLVYWVPGTPPFNKAGSSASTTSWRTRRGLEVG